MAKKLIKWKVKCHIPRTMPPQIMEFIDPFEAENIEKACFMALSILHRSMYRDEQMKKKRTAKDILTELRYSVVRV